jgi:hypothetical protein
MDTTETDDTVLPSNPYKARHLYVRREGKGFAVRCRNTFDIMEAVREGGNAGIVLTIIEDRPGIYDMVKCEDRDLLNFMMETYQSCTLRHRDDYLYFNVEDDRAFRQSWEMIP